MIVECMTCPVRGQRCDDCAVTVLLAPGSAERAAPHEFPSSTRFQLSTELPLDGAENRVVSMFVGAGLVNADAVAGLRARRVTVGGWGTDELWGTVRDVG